MAGSLHKEQLVLSWEESTTVSFPALDIAPVKTRCWSLQHQILAKGITREVSTRSQLSGKQKGHYFITTDKGEKIFLVDATERTPPLPEGFTGALKTEANGTSTFWSAHAELARYNADTEKGLSARRDRVVASWKNALAYSERVSNEEPGFRKPQLGALHAIGAHWSLTNEPALVIMPTGTGKTETMLAAMIGYSCKCILVVTPTTAVRDQVADKFKTLGKLREFGLVNDKALYPVVGILKRRPRTLEELDVFKRCNVVVSTVSAIAQGTGAQLVPHVAELCSHLFIDEAHHVAAKSWHFLKEAFSKRIVLQFTATPYREDGHQVEGRLIYNYPLATAQTDDFFRKISFIGLFEENEELEDEAIAKRAIEQLKKDREAGHDHLLMARCHTKDRAREIVKIYQRLAPEFSPIDIHSDIQRAKDKTDRLFKRESRIVVCVNMLAEGFDLPNLKIAAIHDKHKSLGVLLQFIGRFTRSAPSSENIHNATVVANLADPDVADALQELYVEDADWDKLLADVSFDKLERERRILEFMRSAKGFGLDDKRTRPKVALKTIRPKQSAIIYEAEKFHPEKFIETLTATDDIQDAWIVAETPMLITVNVYRDRILWTRNRKVFDEVWELSIAYFHKQSGLLFIHGSDTESLYGELASAVTSGTARRLEGNDCFRVFGRVNRLTLHQAGVKKQGARRAFSYMQVTGSDVKPTLEMEHSRKAMIAGTGFENGAKVALGGSRKGKVWARQSGVLPDFIDWCNAVAERLRDKTIDPDAVLRDGLKAEAVDAMPSATPLRIEWGERLHGAAMNTSIRIGKNHFSIYECDIEIRDRRDNGNIEFAIIAIDGSELLWLYHVDEKGFQIKLLSDTDAEIHRGKRSESLTDFFQEDPPSILFVDGSELMGAEIFRPKAFGGEFSDEQLLPMTWQGVDLKQESLWKDGIERTNSIQARAIELCEKDGFDFIFNDDDAGEVADLVAFKKTDDGFVVRLLHCKFSKRKEAGARISDVTEVAAQAARSVKYTGRFHELTKQLKRRAKRLQGKPTRYVKGGSGVLSRYERLATAVAPTYEVIVVQPGVKKTAISFEQKTVLAAADAYLRQTVELSLQVWCSV